MGRRGGWGESSFPVDRPSVPCHLQVPQLWAVHAGLWKESPILSSSFSGEVDMNTKVGMNAKVGMNTKVGINTKGGMNTKGGAGIVSLVFTVS